MDCTHPVEDGIMDVANFVSIGQLYTDKGCPDTINVFDLMPIDKSLHTLWHYGLLKAKVSQKIHYCTKNWLLYIADSIKVAFSVGNW